MKCDEFEYDGTVSYTGRGKSLLGRLAVGDVSAVYHDGTKASGLSFESGRGEKREGLTQNTSKFAQHPQL